MQIPPPLAFGLLLAFGLGLVSPSLTSAQSENATEARSLADYPGDSIQRIPDIVVVPVPLANRLASRKIIRTHKQPNPYDVSSVRTLPGITWDGKNVPQRSLQVRFSGTETQIAAGFGKREVAYPGSTSASVASSSSNSSNDGGNAVPFQTSAPTLRVCNVAPPPFRTLASYEGPRSLSNGVVSLLFYRGERAVGVCSGWLVHPLRVVTAAHCVYDAEARSFYYNRGETLVASVGLNGRDDTQLTRATVASVVVSSKYTNNNEWSQSLSEGSDNAVLRLGSRLNGRIYRWARPAPGSVRMVLGYPGVSQSGFDQIGDIVGTPGAPLSFGCMGTSRNILCENLSTEGGHSGSPLFAAYNRAIVVGTLSGGRVDACPSLFTLAVPRVAGGAAVTELLRTSGCTVTSAAGVSSVTRC